MTSQARIDLERSVLAGGIWPKGHQNRKHDVRCPSIIRHGLGPKGRQQRWAAAKIELGGKTKNHTDASADQTQFKSHKLFVGTKR